MRGCSCVDFCGRSLLVDWRLAQVVTPFVLLLDAENKVNEDDDEEDGEDETNCSTRNNSYKPEIENVREAQPRDTALKPLQKQLY